MPLLIVAVIFQVVMTGGVFSLTGKAGLEQVAWLSPSRWGFAAMGSTSNLNVIQLPALPKAPAGKKPAGGTSHGQGGKQTPGPSGSPGPSSSAAPSGSPGPSSTPGPSSSAASSASPGPSSSAAPSGSAGAAAAHSTGKKHGAGKKNSQAATAAAPADASATTPDPLWNHKARTWLTDMAAMVLLGLAFTLIAWWRLVRLSPGRRR